MICFSCSWALTHLNFSGYNNCTQFKCITPQDYINGNKAKNDTKF